MAFELPPEFDAAFYRGHWADLAGLDDDQAAGHYMRHGRAEGRRANALATREDFVALIPPGLAGLEIGPFCRPLLHGPQARYFDVLDQAGLRARARQIGMPPDSVPHIHYVSPVGDLGVVTDRFDAVLSSHCIEHQPDLVAHLRQVHALLRARGRYFLLIPDHRYIFDAFIPPSSVAAVLEAHESGRRVHTLRSVIEHRALTTHNDPEAHWRGEHGGIVEQAARLQAAVTEWQAADGGYVDVHAWSFTPDSAVALIGLLRETGYIGLTVERIYPTRRNANEFWMVLRKSG